MGLGTTIYRALMAGNVWIYRRTGGRIGSQGGKVILLTTTGRKTGLSRTNALMGFDDGERILIVASAGGSDKNPDWYHNLKANPSVIVERGPESIPMTARVAGSEERPGMWALVVDRDPRFARYENRVSREIPVVILEERN